MVVCSYDGCKTRATYNFKGSKTPIYCAKHKEKLMVNIFNNVCEYKDCILKPMFDIKGGKGRFCVSHKTAEMVDIYHTLCEHDGCTKRPSFGLQGGKSQFCATHKKEGMINTASKYCEQPGCTVVNPVFDIKGGKGRFCATHKTPEMVDVKHKRCEFEDCDIQAAYDIKGGKGRFCATHKLPEMVDIKNKYCEQLGCSVVSPIFNFKGANIGRFCATHKLSDMVDVKHKLCEFEDCSKRPNFDIKGGKGRFCLAHKHDVMVDITHKSCEFADCTKRPNFDIKGGKGRFCVTHKTDDMVDIANKLCIVENCKVRARYGKPGHMVSHCSTHKEKGMICKPTSKCTDCNELAIWGTNLTPQHCELHRASDEINLVEQNCKSCNLLYILDKDGLCENCNPSMWKTAQLSKQNTLMSYLDSRGLTGESTDKVIDSGKCGKERPDRIFDFEDKIVILECDENQHKDRNCECEQVRMINISQSFGGLPVYFIRWNPDDYIPKKKDKQMENITKRHKLCGDLITDIKEGRITLPTSFVSVIYLYFDGWSSLTDENWEILTNLTE